MLSHAQRGETVEVTFGTDCAAAYEITVEWPGFQQPRQLTVDMSSLIGDGPITEEKYSQERPAGVWIQRATPNMLRASSKVPHVTVNVGDSAAICLADNDCEFSLSDSEEEVTNVAFDGSTVTLTVSGGISESDIDNVYIGRKACENLSVVGNTVTAEVPADACGGENKVFLAKSNFGRIRNSADNIIDIAFTVSDITPSSGSVAGGTTVTMTGSGFCKKNIMNNFQVAGVIDVILLMIAIIELSVIGLG